MRYWNRLSRKVMGSLPLVVFKKSVDVAVSDMVQSSHRHGLTVGLGDLGGLSNLDDSMTSFPN